MAEAHVNGVRLYYEEHGKGDPILCIHGTSSSAMVWRPEAIDELSRPISRALTPFFDAHISKMTNTHVRTGILVPCITVSVRTENWRRHAPHFQRRRWVALPVRVSRLLPLAGVRNQHLSSFPQCGQTGEPCQRSSSRYSYAAASSGI